MKTSQKNSKVGPKKKRTPAQPKAQAGLSPAKRPKSLKLSNEACIEVQEFTLAKSSKRPTPFHAAEVAKERTQVRLKTDRTRIMQGLKLSLDPRPEAQEYDLDDSKSPYRLEINAKTGRSRLNNLTKEQIVETIIAQKPITGYVTTEPFLMKGKPNRRKQRFFDDAYAKLAIQAKKLMRLSREALEMLIHKDSDLRLNLRYKAQQQTIKEEKAQVPKDRKLELTSKWKRDWAKRDKSAYKQNAAKIHAKLAKKRVEEKKALDEASRKRLALEEGLIKKAAAKRDAEGNVKFKAPKKGLKKTLSWIEQIRDTRRRQAEAEALTKVLSEAIEKEAREKGITMSSETN